MVNFIYGEFHVWEISCMVNHLEPNEGRNRKSKHKLLIKPKTSKIDSQTTKSTVFYCEIPQKGHYCEFFSQKNTLF
jgi:hypothetical protein